MSRAEKRRAARTAGYRRSPRKSGRRGAVRAPRAEQGPVLPALEAAGFVLARPRILVPGKTDG